MGNSLRLNKKANGWLLDIIIFIFIFAAGMILMQYLGNDVISARLALSCASPSSITDGTKLTCLEIDIVIPFFIAIVITGGIRMLAENL